MRQAHERFSIHKRAAFPASLTDETAVSYCTSVNAMIDKIFSKIASSKEEHNKALEVMQQEVSAAQAAAVEAATMVASARSQLQELTASKNKIDAEISQKERLAAGMETINRGFDEEKRLIAEWLKEHNESDIEVAISNLRETLETSRRMATEISRNVASMTEKVRFSLKFEHFRPSYPLYHGTAHPTCKIGYCYGALWTDGGKI
jgi:septal ring factor EnvC (AmiA/AmiB activator)